MDKTIVKKDLKDYIDRRGMVVHLDSEGNPTDAGDAAQRNAFIKILERLLCRLSQKDGGYRYVKKTKLTNLSPYELFELLERWDGEWVRHWNAIRWPGQSGTMSRDNMKGLIWLMGLVGDTDALKKVAWNLIKRGGFFWNTKHIGQTEGWKVPDFSGPFVWSIFFRGLKLWFLWPLIVLFDIPLLINSIVIVLVSYIDPDATSNDLNHFEDVECTAILFPTPISWFARYIYYKFRGRAGVDREHRLEGYGPQTALKHYFRPPEAPPIDEMATPIITARYK